MLVLGVGNPMKGDDGIGPAVASRLASLCSEPGASPAEDGSPHIIALNCGTTPENYTSVVRRVQPQWLVIVDAAEMDISAGACRIIPHERVGALGLSTHSMPLSLFMSYVSDLVDEIMLVGVQPVATTFGSELSQEAVAAIDALVACVMQGRLRDLPLLD